MFPLDIFPKIFYQAISLLPFPYLLFFQANVYLGKITGPDFFKGLTVMLFWLIVGIILLRKEWKLGLETYQSEGR